MGWYQTEMEFYIGHPSDWDGVLHCLFSKPNQSFTRADLRKEMWSYTGYTSKKVQVCVLYLHEQGILTCLSSFIMVSACMRCREALYSGVMMFSVIREAISCEVRGSVLCDILVTLWIIEYPQRIIYLYRLLGLRFMKP